MARLEKKNPVYYIMTENIVVATLETKYSDIEKLFLNYDAHHLPVIDKGNLVGIISEHDMLKASVHLLEQGKCMNLNDMDERFKVADWMTKNPVTINKRDPIADAAKSIAEHKFEALPVLGDDGELVGIVTARDLVKQLNKAYTEKSYLF
jgi:acetoin utilization protein AcuB